MRIAFTRAVVSLFWVATALYALLSASAVRVAAVPAAAARARRHRVRRLAYVDLARGTRGDGSRPRTLARAPRPRRLDVRRELGAGHPGGVLHSAAFRRWSPRCPRCCCRLRRCCRRHGWRCSICAARQRRAPGAPADTSALPDFLACGAAALVVTVTHAVLTLRSGRMPAAQWVVELGRSALLHLVVFLCRVRADLRHPRRRAPRATPGRGRGVARQAGGRGRCSACSCIVWCCRRSRLPVRRRWSSPPRSGRRWPWCSGRAARRSPAASNAALARLRAAMGRRRARAGRPLDRPGDERGGRRRERRSRAPTGTSRGRSCSRSVRGWWRWPRRSGLQARVPPDPCRRGRWRR